MSKIDITTAWNDTRRVLTIYADSPDYKSFRIEAGYAPNSHVAFGASPLIFANPKHDGNYKPLYVRAVGSNDEGEDLESETFTTVPILHPILGQAVDCDTRKNIVDIVEKKEDGTLTERWQIGDRVRRVEKCPDPIPDEGGTVSGTIHINGAPDDAVISYDAIVGPLPATMPTCENSFYYTCRRGIQFTFRFNVYDLFPDMIGATGSLRFEFSAGEVRKASNGVTPIARQETFVFQPDIVLTIGFPDTQSINDPNSTCWFYRARVDASIGSIRHQFFICIGPWKDNPNASAHAVEFRTETVSDSTEGKLVGYLPDNVFRLLVK